MGKLSFLLALAFSASILQANAASNPPRKCVDDKGKVYYGDTIPPEVMAKCRSISEISKKGEEVKKTIILTEQEKQAQAGMTARANQEKRGLEEQKRKDKALLSSYSSEKEIHQALERNLAQTKAQLQSIESRLKAAKDKNAEYKKQADGFSQQKKAVPADLTNDISRTENEVKSIESEKAKKLQEEEEIKTRFEADKLRYRTLTGNM